MIYKQGQRNRPVVGREEQGEKVRSRDRTRQQNTTKTNHLETRRRKKEKKKGVTKDIAFDLLQYSSS